MTVQRLTPLAFIGALGAVAGGCGGSGGGAAAPGLVAAGPQSAPRGAQGMQFMQSADKAVYVHNAGIAITFVVSNITPPDAGSAVQYEITDAPYFVGEAVSSTGQTVALNYPVPSGGGHGAQAPGSIADTMEPMTQLGFTQTIAPGTLPAGTWKISSWLTAVLTGPVNFSIDFPPGAEQTTEYANPITIQVLP